ncbi:hypothetical protein A6R68_02970 [Neotoma lepida]|uniref:Large ribosomal subunit protein eL19 n=1 Tax=Neotoma lepida TaxID=56216 RepID=A0A1A6GQA4_NEOLE|nr:hypothetical protein A6R68_02970 [Neotoma lepida]
MPTWTGPPASPLLHLRVLPAASGGPAAASGGPDAASGVAWGLLEDEYKHDPHLPTNTPPQPSHGYQGCCTIQTAAAADSTTTSSLYFRLSHNMLRLLKMVASSVLCYGKKKDWLNPNETNEIANANSHQQIQKLIRDGLIIQKPATVHSQAQCWKKYFGSREGQAYGHREAEGCCQCSNAQESDLDEKDADAVPTSQEIPKENRALSDP